MTRMESLENLAQNVDQWYRISELVEASGVTREMIKYYLRMQLLPAPKKIRANLSLYSEQHLRLIRLILRFQDQTKLSLPKIADVFQSAQHDVTQIERTLLSDKFPGTHRNSIISSESPVKTEWIRLTAPESFLQRLISVGLLSNASQLDENEQKIADTLWAATSEGIPEDFFQKVQAMLKELANLQVETILAARRPVNTYDCAVDRVELLDGLINRWLTVEKYRQVSERFDQVIESSERALTTIHDNIYVPSEIFCTRHKVDEQLIEFQEKMKNNGKGSNLNIQLCIASIYLGKFPLTDSIIDQALKQNAQDYLAMGLKCYAHGIAGDLDKMWDCSLSFEGCQKQNPIIMEARLLALLMRAAQMGGIADNRPLLKEAIELFRELPDVVGDDHFQQLEKCLLVARANIIFPDAINSRQQAIDELKAMRCFLTSQNQEDTGFSIACLKTVYEIYISYYLGVLYQGEGEDVLARECFEEVIKLDPASNFGEAAYLRLG